jgi:hypothetical protein
LLASCGDDILQQGLITNKPNIMLKLLLFISGFFLLLPFYGTGQSDTLNQTDSRGLKQGYWIITGEMKPDKGLCSICIYEEGTYVDDRKNGIWKKYYRDGQTLRLQGTYVNNRPNGPYIKYYESGCIREEGTFEYKKNRSYKLYSEDCRLEQERWFDKDGKEISSVQYLSNGCKALETKKRQDGSYKVDIYRYSKVDCNVIDSTYEGPYVTQCFGNIQMDIKEIVYLEGDCDYFEILDTLIDGHHEIKDSLGRLIIDAEISDGWIEKGNMFCWNENGMSIEYKYKNKLIKNFKKVQSNKKELAAEAPSGENGITKSGIRFNPNGCNKLYDKEDELWLDGEFREGKLFNGKHYLYESDGILLKIEVYKQGKYHSDGQL